MNAEHMPLSRVFARQAASDRLHYDYGWLRSHRLFGSNEEGGMGEHIWGPLVVFNEDIVRPGRGFDAHPHQDMEILTYVLEGSLEHEDSTGKRGIVSPGGVQFIGAGTGVFHSEYNHSQVESLRFLQMWVMPETLGNAPSYGQVSFEERDRINHLLPLASGRAAVNAPITLSQDAALFATRLEDGHQLRHTFDPARLGFLFIAEGKFEASSIGDYEPTSSPTTLHVGDSLSIAGVERVLLTGSGVAVLWDLPPRLD